jgi:hypothetical protein
MKSSLVFNILIAIRIIFPPIIFSVFHPFIAMLLNECVLDGLVSPYHFFKKYVPPTIKHDKLTYDMPLDIWGFLNGLIPVLYTGNKFYNVFENHRALIVASFVFRLIGYVVAYRTRSWRGFLIFQNFYISIYLGISFCDFFKIKQRDQVRVIALFIIIFVLREFYLVSINKVL